jgi:hypothetical protein
MCTPLIIFAKKADTVIHILLANGEKQRNASFTYKHITAVLFFLLSFGMSTRWEMKRWQPAAM